MSTPPRSPLMAAVAAYKRSALGEISGEEVQEAVALLKRVNQQLPGRNLLDTDKASLKVAGGQVLADPALAGRGPFLSRELRRFYDAAFAAGMIARHPLTAHAQLPAVKPDIEPDGRAAAVAAEIVTGLIEEGIQAGMMLSPLALPVAQIGGGRSRLDELVEGLEGRWAALAEKVRGVLAVVRVALPVVAVVLAVSTIISGKDPVGSRATAAFSTGNAMQEIKIMANMLDSMEGRAGDLETFEDLGQWAGVPTDQAAEIFELEAARLHPTVLYLRHRASGVLVMVSPDQRATLAGDRIRVRQ